MWLWSKRGSSKTVCTGKSKRPRSTVGSTRRKTKQLAEIIKYPCLPKPGSKQSVRATSHGDRQVSSRPSAARRRRIDDRRLQSGNGLKRCRDRSELGFERYVALAVLGRNLHTLGRLLIAREDADCEAAKSKRKRAAA